MDGLRRKKTISALLAVAAVAGCGLTVAGQSPPVRSKPAPPNRAAPKSILLPPEARNLIRKATGAVGLIQVRSVADEPDAGPQAQRLGRSY